METIIPFYSINVPINSGHTNPICILPALLKGRPHVRRGIMYLPSFQARFCSRRSSKCQNLGTCTDVWLRPKRIVFTLDSIPPMFIFPLLLRRFYSSCRANSVYSSMTIAGRNLVGRGGSDRNTRFHSPPNG